MELYVLIGVAFFLLLIFGLLFLSLNSKIQKQQIAIKKLEELSPTIPSDAKIIGLVEDMPQFQLLTQSVTDHSNQKQNVNDVMKKMKSDFQKTNHDVEQVRQDFKLYSKSMDDEMRENSKRIQNDLESRILSIQNTLKQIQQQNEIFTAQFNPMNAMNYNEPRYFDNNHPATLPPIAKTPRPLFDNLAGSAIGSGSGSGSGSMHPDKPDKDLFDSINEVKPCPPLEFPLQFEQDIAKLNEELETSLKANKIT